MEGRFILDLFKDVSEEDQNKVMNQLMNYISQYILGKMGKYIRKDSINIFDDISELYSIMSKARGLTGCDFEDKEKRKAYYFGALNMAKDLFEIINEHDKQKKDYQCLIKKYKYTNDFFRTLYLVDELTANEICKKLKISKSTLRRFLKEIKEFNYFYSKKVGRSLVYTLSHIGNDLYWNNIANCEEDFFSGRKNEQQERKVESMIYKGKDVEVIVEKTGLPLEGFLRSLPILEEEVSKITSMEKIMNRYYNAKSGSHNKDITLLRWIELVNSLEELNRVYGVSKGTAAEQIAFEKWNKRAMESVEAAKDIPSLAYICPLTPPDSEAKRLCYIKIFELS